MRAKDRCLILAASGAGLIKVSMLGFHESSRGVAANRKVSLYKVLRVWTRRAIGMQKAEPGPSARI